MDDDCKTKLAVLAEIVRQQELRAQEAFRSRDLAVAKAAEGINYRLEGMNEFREQIAHQATTLLPKDEYRIQHQMLVEKIDRVADQLAPLTKANIIERLTKSTDAVTALQLRRESAAGSWAMIAGIISAVASLGAIMAVLFHFKMGIG